MYINYQNSTFEVCQILAKYLADSATNTLLITSIQIKIPKQNHIIPIFIYLKMLTSFKNDDILI